MSVKFPNYTPTPWLYSSLPAHPVIQSELFDSPTKRCTRVNLQNQNWNQLRAFLFILGRIQHCLNVCISILIWLVLAAMEKPITFISTSPQVCTAKVASSRSFPGYRAAISHNSYRMKFPLPAFSRITRHSLLTWGTTKLVDSLQFANFSIPQ